MKVAAQLVPAVVLVAGVAWQASLPGVVEPVAYPEGYRTWAHVKSATISPTHKNFAVMGGFQHIYANPEAMAGYRTRNFPERSVIVVDWLEMKDVAGAFIEGPRRQVDVMVKDSSRYAGTGGWGFQRFVKDSKTELATTPSPPQCFACHNNLKKDGLVLSAYRP
jgi:hypothetical protein